MSRFSEEEKTIDINYRSVKMIGRRDTDTGCKHAERKELVCKDNIKYTVCCQIKLKHTGNRQILIEYKK
jgi:hypothetical protein